jgi:hypothetical protein
MFNFSFAKAFVATLATCVLTPLLHVNAYSYVCIVQVRGRLRLLLLRNISEERAGQLIDRGLMKVVNSYI